MIKDIRTFKDLELACSQQHKAIYEVFQEREARLSEISVEEVRAKVKKSLDAMKEAIKKGSNTREKSISKQCGDDCVHFLNDTKNVLLYLEELTKKLQLMHLQRLKKTCVWAKL